MLILVALMLCAALADLAWHRIPNLLVAAGLLLALVSAGAGGGVMPVGNVTLGAAIGLLLLLPFYAKGGMGAGDVKLSAMSGAFLGPVAVIGATLYTLIAGAMLALLYLFARGGLGPLVRRYGAMFRWLVALGRVNYIAPAGGDAAATTRFPYALAIAVGACVSLWLHVPTGGAAWLP